MNYTYAVSVRQRQFSKLRPLIMPPNYPTKAHNQSDRTGWFVVDLQHNVNATKYGGGGRIRIHDISGRNRSFYPTELHPHFVSEQDVHLDQTYTLPEGWAVAVWSKWTDRRNMMHRCRIYRRRARSQAANWTQNGHVWSYWWTMCRCKCSYEYVKISFKILTFWYWWQDLNLHGVIRWILNPVRIPIPPHQHKYVQSTNRTEDNASRTARVLINFEGGTNLEVINWYEYMIPVHTSWDVHLIGTTIDQNKI